MSRALDRHIRDQESREADAARRQQEKETVSTTTEPTSIELVIQQQPSIALLDPKKKEELYAFLEREIDAFEPDLSTETSRKKIAALAYKVARTKTAIDDAGAKLKEEWLKKSQAIDLGRREIREKLDELKERARRPLTEWEAAEESRVAKLAKVIEGMQLAPRLLATDTSDDAAKILEAVEAEIIIESFYQDRFVEAMALKGAAITSLERSIAALKQKEADAIELDRLRAEQAAREKADREAAEAAELARLHKEREEREKVRQQELAESARQAEEKRVQLEQQRIAQAAKDADEKARRESEAKAKAESDRIAAEHAAELEKERRARLEAEEKQRLESERIARDEQDRKKHEALLAAKAEEKAEAERKLAANKKHRQTVMTEAKVALMAHAKLSEESAQAVVRAIVAEKIPHTVLRFTA